MKGGATHDPVQPKDGKKGTSKGDGTSFGMSYMPVKAKGKTMKKKRKPVKRDKNSGPY